MRFGREQWSRGRLRRLRQVVQLAERALLHPHVLDQERLELKLCLLNLLDARRVSFSVADQAVFRLLQAVIDLDQDARAFVQ